jgi:hypothetical protein
MDEMNSAFWGLSTKASEWKPTSSATSSSLTGSSDPQSDLKATAVKEFVPGRAWTAAAAAQGEIHPWSQKVMHMRATFAARHLSFASLLFSYSPHSHSPC